MSKASRKRNKDKRAAKRRAEKVANQNLYAERAKLGINKKSKRARTGAKKKGLVNPGETHPDGYCGNIGCVPCNQKFHSNMRRRKISETMNRVERIRRKGKQ